jgi:hypothetical protein
MCGAKIFRPPVTQQKSNGCLKKSCGIFRRLNLEAIWRSREVAAASKPETFVTGFCRAESSVNEPGILVGTTDPRQKCFGVRSNKSTSQPPRNISAVAIRARQD